MGRGWTPERRAAQSEAIRIWHPWSKSTGPRTSEGKQRTARNAYRGGHWKTSRDLNRLLTSTFQKQASTLREMKTRSARSLSNTPSLESATSFNPTSCDWPTTAEVLGLVEVGGEVRVHGNDGR